MLSLLAALLVLSFSCFRRHIYEIFIKTHLLFALALVGVLWFHIPLENKQASICLGVSIGLWLLQEFVRLTRLSYRNFGSGFSPKAITLSAYPSPSTSPQGMSVTLTLKKPWRVLPGQYVCITLPGLSLRYGSFAQSHPYTIAWSDGVDITLLVQKGSGFSNSIFSSSRSISSVIIDGPYGYTQEFKCYDKVLFIASGIGIVSHLLEIKALIEAHEDKSARVRRITLIWFLETYGTQALRQNSNDALITRRSRDLGQPFSPSFV
jgi:predicted ferric reductase